MGWNEGIKLGLAAYDDAMRRQQLERENKRADERLEMDRERTRSDAAWANEQRARERAAWADTDKLNLGIDEYRTNALKTLQTPWESQDVRAQLGLAPRAAPNYDRQELDFGAPAQAPEAPLQGLAPSFVQQQRANLASQVGVAGRDRALIAAALEQDRKLQLSNTDAQIRSFVQSADPTQLAELASKVTLDPRNRYEIKIDPKTQLSTIVHGDKKVELSRGDLGKFLSASYRLKQGDASAAADIDSIDTKLTGIVTDSLNVASKVAQSNNDAASKDETRRHNRVIEGNEAKRIDAAAHTAKMGLVRSYVDGDGNVKEMYPVTDKSGSVVWSEIKPPPGTKPYRPNDSTFHQAPAEGTLGTMNGKPVKADGAGGYVAQNGVLPSEREGLLTKGGLTALERSAVKWNVDGTGVTIRNDLDSSPTSYDPTVPSELRALQEQLRAAFAAKRQMAESEVAAGVPNSAVRGRTPVYGNAQFAPATTRPAASVVPRNAVLPRLPD